MMETNNALAAAADLAIKEQGSVAAAATCVTDHGKGGNKN
jgi:cytochrome c553